MYRFKRILILLLVVGALGTLGAGTFATFTAQTTNPNNTFTTGTIVLSQKVNSNTTCYSTLTSNTGGNGQGTFTNGNSNPACDSVAFATLAAPGSASSANFTVQNNGSLGASSLTLQMTGCSTSNSGASYHGNGDLCSVLGVYVQEYDSTFTTPNGKCALPVNGAANCSTASTTSFATLATAQTLWTSVAAGQTHYVKVVVVFPDGGPGADNAYQGRVATFNATWQLNQ